MSLKALQSGTYTITTYSYAAAGNRQSMQVGSVAPINYYYNVLNQLTESGTSPCGSASNTAYIYDARGNLNLVKNNGSTTAIYIFDVRNHLTQVASGSAMAAFSYDALGERIQSLANCTTTNFL